jgi:DNA excision repair protein ERCC-2
MSRPIPIAVRDFALPAPRTGSIEVHSGYAATTEQGVEIHVAIQAERSRQIKGYAAEVPLAHVFTIGKLSFRVGGRIDGIVPGQPPLLEEIKSAFDAEGLARRLDARDDHPYRLQLQTYAYLYQAKHGVVPALRMTIVSTRTRAPVAEMPVEYDAARYEAWLGRRLAELELEEKSRRALDRRRKKLGAALTFPFATPRPGQSELMAELETALVDRDHVMIQAPTGLGKTLGILYPTLRHALLGGSPVVYVTPKNSQHRVAEDAVRQLQQAGSEKLGIRSLTLTAKSRICMKDEPVCTPERCEFARNYYAKVAAGKLTHKLATHPVVTEATLKGFALQYEVCPYELSLDAAPLFDVLVGDYNYVIGPHGLVGRLTAALRGKTCQPSLVVDEAHNLFVRANENLSAALSRNELERLEADAASLPPEFVGGARALARQAVALIASVAPARINAARVTPAAKMVERLGEATQVLMALYLASPAVIGARDPVLTLVNTIGSVLAALAQPGDAFVTLYERAKGDEILRVVCCDARDSLAQSFSAFRRVVGFSATLKPFDYYARLSGFNLERLHTAEFTSPFPQANRKLLIIPQVSTRYRDRAREAGRIADAVQRIAAVRPGNYVVFFPSFKFLDDTAAYLTAQPGITLLVQKPQMTRHEVTACLQQLAEPGQLNLLLAVAGGGLSEGVDYPGDLLVGAIIVGPAIPGVGPAREALRDYYQKHYGQGDDYAYTYPAMAKVIQAAGRVIRSERDRGVIVLIDGRFVERRYSDQMPRDWFVDSVHELVSTSILSDLRAFWERAGATP